MNSHAKWLRQTAHEIAKEGHAGWGNTCTQAADEIERLTSEKEGDAYAVSMLGQENEQLRAENKVLREYYEASNAAWQDVIDVWASDDDGRALHARLAKAERGVEEFDSGKHSQEMTTGEAATMNKALRKSVKPVDTSRNQRFPEGAAECGNCKERAVVNCETPLEVICLNCGATPEQPVPKGRSD